MTMNPGFSSQRHAYLILCHNNFKILQMLLSAIDDDRNDIYIHVDKKTVDIPFEDIWSAVCHSPLTFIERTFVNWGGYSQINVELALLSEATKTLHAYYHLISGVDFPLKSQADIHQFFDDNAGKEYISFDQCKERMEEYKDRIRYYHWLQDKIGRNSGKLVAIMYRLENASLRIQRMMKVDRLKYCPYEIKKGANWFSITHNLATYLLSQKNIRKYFGKSLCTDELVVQTLAYASQYRDNIAGNNLRFIDWHRGSPYTFTSDDYSQLVESDRLFARKFDENVDLNIVEMLLEHVKTK